MRKIKSTFVCQNCGAKSSKWIGKCPSCQQWNTFTEEVIKQTSSIEKLISNSTTKQSKPMLLQDVQPISNNRIHFSDKVAVIPHESCFLEKRCETLNLVSTFIVADCTLSPVD